MSDSSQNTTEHELTPKTSPPRERPAAGDASPAAGIAEQQPIMRFVDMSSTVPPQRALHFEQPLRRADPGDGRPALLGLRSASAAKLHIRGAMGAKPALDRSRSVPALARPWRVDPAALSRRPADGLPPLRTARVVQGAPAPVVADRLADCLRARSIAAQFAAEGATPVARCRNVALCKFTIRLHAEGREGVLVEVQRLCGDCVSFMQDCRALLRAAEGEGTEGGHRHGGTDCDQAPLYLRLPVSQMDFVKTADVPPVSPADEAGAVAVTVELLASQRSDTNRLGMESLVIQTDPLKTLRSTAVRVSNLVLCPDNPGNAPFNVHNYVMSLLIYGSEGDSEENAPLHPAQDFPEDSALADHYAHLRILGLSALSNALALLADEDLLPTTLSPHDEWYASVLITRLLRDLGAAAARPLEACYAARCLTTLARSSPGLARKVRAGGGHDAVAHAEGVGAREFALLARDAGRCRHTLHCCV